MSHHAYIFVHDEQIINHFRRNNYHARFFGDNYTYVFLGSKPVADRTHVIVALDYSDNIEQYPKAVAYTGWYLLWKNNLVTADHITLLEYDTEINDDQTMQYVEYDLQYYFEFPISHCFFPFLYDSHYNPQNFNRDTWIASLNVSWNTQIWQHFMEWFHNNHFVRLCNQQIVGHIIERFITIYAHEHNIKTNYIAGVLEHHGLDSHNTQTGLEKYNKYMETIG